MKMDQVIRKIKVFRDENEDVIFLFFFALLWTKDTLLSYCRGVIDGIGFLVIAYDITYFLVLFVCGLLLLERVRKRVCGEDWWFVGGIAALYAATIQLSPAAQYASEHFGFFFFQVLPFYFIGLCMPDREAERKVFYRITFYLSAIAALAGFAYMFYYRITGRDFSGPNNMDISYKNIMSIMYVIWYARREKNVWGYLVAAAGLVFLLGMGTRGVQLAAVIWIVICFVFIGKHRKTKILLVGAASLVVVILSASGLIIPIAQGMKNVFDTLGLNSRVFDFVIESSIFDGNGREELWGPAVEALRILPGGLLYDRVIFESHYVHNLLLELLLHFGVPVGISLICMLFVGLFKVTVRAEGADKWFLVMFCCLFAVKLMLSSSYLNEPYFFLMIGVAKRFGRSYTRRKVTLYNGKSILI